MKLGESMAIFTRFRPWYTCLGCGATADSNKWGHGAVYVTRMDKVAEKALCGTCGATWNGHQWETAEGEKLENPVLGIHG